MPLFGNNFSKGIDMRRTNNPNVICPDDLYSQDELLRMEEISFLEEQIRAISRDLLRMEHECNIASRAGDYDQVIKIEDRMENLSEIQDHLQGKIEHLSDPDARDVARHPTVVHRFN